MPRFVQVFGGSMPRISFVGIVSALVVVGLDTRVDDTPEDIRVLVAL